MTLSALARPTHNNGGGTLLDQFLKERPQSKSIILFEDKERTFLNSYKQICESLNISRLLSKTNHVPIFEFLAEHKIEVFDCDEVYSFLGNVCKEINQVWNWVALRDIGLEKQNSNSFSWPFYTVKIKTPQTFMCKTEIRVGRVSSRYQSIDSAFPTIETYNKVIPIEVLRNVQKIENQFPDQFGFFVSDVSLFEDPFICLHSKELEKPIIFGVWDEPSFRLKG